ncbi:Uma2 family endonuclease [Streptomyces sp. NPDC059080]|uniref:Uma2 family endonuclease n=1 Tax=Streptomyces sp. NPDC059080 TaxID=3346718 RepID=UPI0036A48713
MTAVDERRMTELFENIDVPEGVKVELLRGEIVMMAGPDLVHNRIVQEVMDQIPRKRWERLQTQDIDILSEQSEPVPDLVVLESGAGPESGRLLPSAVVTMVVEVVSKTSVDRDYGIKRSLYAAGKIPAYLIVDPIVGHCVLLTEPFGSGDEADYAVQRISKFGESVPVDVLDVELETGDFGILPGVRPHRRP